MTVMALVVSFDRPPSGLADVFRIAHFAQARLELLRAVFRETDHYTEILAPTLNFVRQTFWEDKTMAIVGGPLLRAPYARRACKACGRPSEQIICEACSIKIRGEALVLKRHKDKGEV
jgi:hypothetical protein